MQFIHVSPLLLPPPAIHYFRCLLWPRIIMERGQCIMVQLVARGGYSVYNVWYICATKKTPIFTLKFPFQSIAFFSF